MTHRGLITKQQAQTTGLAWSTLARGAVDQASVILRGLPVTRPSRIAADLLADREDLGAVAQVVVDALRPAFEDPGSVASAIAPHAVANGLQRGDGIGLLRWLLELSGDADSEKWLAEAMAADGRSPGVA